MSDKTLANRTLSCEAAAGAATISCSILKASQSVSLEEEAEDGGGGATWQGDRKRKLQLNSFYVTVDVQVGVEDSLRTEVELGFVFEPHAVISRGQKNKIKMECVPFGFYIWETEPSFRDGCCVCVEILDIGNVTPRANLFPEMSVASCW